MKDELLAELRSHVGVRIGPVLAWDRVNETMIRHWREAIDVMGSELSAPRTTPVTMLPVWLMPGLNGQPAPGSDLRDHRAIMKVLEREGYRGILGTNCEQDYERHLVPGERITSTYEVEYVSDRKQTKFGAGYFITFLQHFHDEAGALVGTMRLRILRYAPIDESTSQGDETNLPPPPQPAMNADTRFFWDGVKRQELLIQQCSACGFLRHPPGPACTRCHSLEWTTLKSKGEGTIYSFVLIHQPAHAAFETPHPVGLVELDEGVRLVAPLRAEERDRLNIGDRVHAVFAKPGPDYRMPIFRLSVGD